MPPGYALPAGVAYIMHEDDITYTIVLPHATTPTVDMLNDPLLLLKKVSFVKDVKGNRSRILEIIKRTGEP